MGVAATKDERTGGLGLTIDQLQRLSFWRGALKYSKIQQSVWKSRYFILLRKAQSKEQLFVIFADGKNKTAPPEGAISLQSCYGYHFEESKCIVISEPPHLEDDDYEDDDEEVEGAKARNKSRSFLAISGRFEPTFNPGEIYLLKYESGQGKSLIATLSQSESLKFSPVVHQGWLAKKSIKTLASQFHKLMTKGNWEKRYCVLMGSGDLLYFKSSTLENLRGRIFLPLCKQVSSSEDEKGNQVLQIECDDITGSGKIYSFRSTAAEDKSPTSQIHNDQMDMFAKMVTSLSEGGIKNTAKELPEVEPSGPLMTGIRLYDLAIEGKAEVLHKKLLKVSSPDRKFKNLNTVHPKLGTTPLHLAVQHARYIVVKVLLKHGARPDTKANSLPACEPHNATCIALSAHLLRCCEEDQKRVRGSINRLFERWIAYQKQLEEKKRQEDDEDEESDSEDSDEEAFSKEKFVVLLKKRLGDDDQFSKFKKASVGFRHGTMDALGYCTLFIRLFKKNAPELFPGVLRLLPNKQKRHTLQAAYDECVARWKDRKKAKYQEQQNKTAAASRARSPSLQHHGNTTTTSPSRVRSTTSPSRVRCTSLPQQNLASAAAAAVAKLKSRKATTKRPELAPTRSPRPRSWTASKVKMSSRSASISRPDDSSTGGDHTQNSASSPVKFRGRGRNMSAGSPTTTRGAHVCKPDLQPTKAKKKKKRKKNRRNSAAATLDSTTSTSPPRPTSPEPLTEEEMRELKWSVDKAVKDWATNKDITELLQTLPFIMKESCRRVGFEPPSRIINSQQLTRAWRKGVLVCHPDKLDRSASLRVRITAKNVFQLVQRKFHIARKNLKKLEKSFSSFAPTAWEAPITPAASVSSTPAPNPEEGLELD